MEVFSTFSGLWFSFDFRDGIYYGRIFFSISAMEKGELRVSPDTRMLAEGGCEHLSLFYRSTDDSSSISSIVEPRVMCHPVV